MKERFRLEEIKLFLILIPFINLFNYYLTYIGIRFTTRTVITFAIDTAQGYSAWLIVHLIIVYLDKTMPYERNVLKRILFQITIVLFAGMSVIILLTISIHLIFEGGKPFPVSFFFIRYPHNFRLVPGIEWCLYKHGFLSRVAGQSG